MKNADDLIADAVKQEEKLDRAEMAPVWTQAAIAVRLGELNETLKETNKLLAAQLVLKAGGPLFPAGAIKNEQAPQLPQAVEDALRCYRDVVEKLR